MILLQGSVAQAEGPRRWLGGGLDYLALERPPYQDQAPGLHLGFRYDLNDQFRWLSEVSLASYDLKQPAPSPCPEPPAPCQEQRFPFPVQGLTAYSGLVYVLDVTRLSPYGGLMLGGARLSAGEGRWQALLGQRAQEIRLGVVLALGAEYRLTERWSLGAGWRLHGHRGGQWGQYLLQVQWGF
jgi:opacity protein-like surface antigen